MKKYLQATEQTKTQGEKQEGRKSWIKYFKYLYMHIWKRFAFSSDAQVYMRLN